MVENWNDSCRYVECDCIKCFVRIIKNSTDTTMQRDYRRIGGIYEKFTNICD